VQAKMRCLKLLGERLMARTFDRQTAELQIRAAILNRFTRLGTPESIRVALNLAGSGETRPLAYLLDKAHETKKLPGAWPLRASCSGTVGQRPRGA